MLRIKYFKEFKNGFPFVVVISDEEGFRAAYNFFSGKKGAFLNDAAITEFSDISPLEDSAIFLNIKECQDIAELFNTIISNDKSSHHYFDVEALGNDIEVIISYREYDGLF